jgi:hypothetical protein
MIHAKRKNNTVAAKAQIRVIKKGGISNVEMPAIVNKLPAKEVSRQMTATIMNWISDLKSRKIEETRLATERFQRT